MSTAKVGADDFIAAGRGADLPEQARTELGLVQPVELHALLARSYPEPDAIIGGGVIPRRGFVVTGGPPKRGKSFAVLQQVLTRTLGWPWLGYSTTPGRSLVMNAEIPEPELQARVRLQLEGISAPFPRDLVHFVTHRGLRLDRPAGLRTTRTLIETLTPDLVVIDPLARFMSGDENSTRDMGRFVAALDELVQAYDVAVLVVHHTAKPSGDDSRDGGDRLRGSSALFGAADSVLLLDRASDGVLRLKMELRHGREPEPMLLHRTEHCWLEPSGPPDELLRVAAIVDRLPLRYSQFIDAIQADLEVKERTAQSLLARAKRAGLFDVEGGLYRSRNHRNGDAAVHGTASHRNPDVAVGESANE